MLCVPSDGFTKKGARCKKNRGPLLLFRNKVISKKKKKVITLRVHGHGATMKK